MVFVGIDVASSELRIHTRSRFRLVQARSKLKLQILRLITVLFPELPSMVWSANQKSTYALLLEFPTAKDIVNAHLARLSNVLLENSHGKYGREKALQIREAARNSIGLTAVLPASNCSKSFAKFSSLGSKLTLWTKKSSPS